MFVTPEVFKNAGGFDVQLGTGSNSAWQSGEGTDFLLRMLRGPHFRGFDWLPDLVINGISDSHGLSSQECRQKLRAYSLAVTGASSRSTVTPRIARYQCSSAAQRWVCQGKAVRTVGRNSWFIGRLDGLLGRTLVDSAPGFDAVGR
jgi:hypothetical protein